MAQTSASNSLMIGDSYEADIAGAIALGMQAFNSIVIMNHGMTIAPW